MRASKILKRLGLGFGFEPALVVVAGDFHGKLPSRWNEYVIPTAVTVPDSIVGTHVGSGDSILEGLIVVANEGDPVGVSESCKELSRLFVKLEKEGGGRVKLVDTLGEVVGKGSEPGDPRPGVVVELVVLVPGVDWPGLCIWMVLVDRSDLIVVGNVFCCGVCSDNPDREVEIGVPELEVENGPWLIGRGRRKPEEASDEGPLVELVLFR